MKCTLLSTPPSHTHSHSHTCKTIKTGRSLQVTYECKAGQWSLIINTALHYEPADSLTLGDSKSVSFSPTSFDMARPGIAPALLACHERTSASHVLSAQNCAVLKPTVEFYSICSAVEMSKHYDSHQYRIDQQSVFFINVTQQTVHVYSTHWTHLGNCSKTGGRRHCR